MFMVEPLDTAGIAVRTRAARAGESAAERAVRQLGVLADLTDLAMDLARLTRVQAFDQAAACAAGAPPMAAQVGGDIGLTFTRIARCVRLTVSLEAALARDVEDAERLRGHVRGDRAATAPAAPRAPVPAPDTARPRRERAEAEVETAEAPDDALDRDPAEVVAEVCAELGAPMTWALWRDGAATAETPRTPRPEPLTPARSSAGPLGVGVLDRPPPARTRWRTSAARTLPPSPSGP